jgi:hypothetical protein
MPLLSLCQKRILRCASLLFPCAGSAAIALSPALQSVYVVTPFAVVGCATLMYAFPKTVVSAVSRPTYLETLEDNADNCAAGDADGGADDSVRRTSPDREIQFRQHARCVFFHSVVVTTSVAFAAVVDYAFFKYQHSSLRGLEIVGIAGGVWSLFHRVHTILTKILFRCLVCAHTRSRARSMSREIEMTVPSSDEGSGV